MGTTDPALALLLLEALERVNVRFAVLHDADSLRSRAAVSDVDVIVDRSPRAVLSCLAREVDDLLPVQAVEYDEGGLATFWFTRDGAAGVQFDMLFDPAGRGAYGLRTSSALAGAVRGELTWELARADQATYVAAKRLEKRQCSRVRDAMAAPGVTGGLSWGLLADGTAARLSRFLSASVLESGRRRRLRRARRLWSRRTMRRLRHPCGVVLRVTGSVGSADLERVAREFGDVLPRVSSVTRSNPVTAVRSLDVIRPGLALCAVGYLPRHATLTAGDERQLRTAVVGAMSARLAKREGWRE